MAHIGSAFRARVQHGYEVEFYSWSLRSIGECVRGGREVLWERPPAYARRRKCP